MHKQVVIARYEEDVLWVHSLECPFIIYNKGACIPEDISNKNIIWKKNIGREGETWLYHIIENYFNLANLTFFLQGNPFLHYPDVIERVNGLYSAKYLIRLGNLHISNENGCPDHCGLRVKDTYREIFGKNKDKQWYEFAAGAQYGVPKELITNKPLHWWRKLYIAYLSHPDNPWIFERLWEDIFNTELNK
jgi:hypothetical protein